MPIDIQCPSCGKRLRAPDDRAGKQVRCPQCKDPFEIPGGAAAAKGRAGPPNPAFAGPVAAGGRPAATKQQAAVWSMQTPDGQQYGPVTKAELNGWLADGRLDNDCQVLMEGWPQWKWADEVFPQLAAGAPAPTPPGSPPSIPTPDFPIVDTSAGAAVAVNPYAPTSKATAGTVEGERTSAGQRSWIVLHTALSITVCALGVQVVFGGVLALLVMIGTLMSESRSTSTMPGPIETRSSPTMPGPMSMVGSAESAYILVVMVIFCMMASFAGYCSMVTGWSVCMQAPGETRSRGLASGAVVGVGASVLLFFVTMLTVMGGNPKVMAVIFWLSVVASYAAYATFSLFAGAVAKYQKQAGAQKQALLLAAVFGGLALLFSFLVYIPMLVTLKKTGNTVMQVFSNLWLFASVAALAWLAMITLEVRKGVRKRI